MKYKKISVHKKDCINVHSLDSEKEVKLSWIEPEELKIKKIRVFINDQPGILAKILTLFASNKINVKSVNTRPRKKRIILTFKVDESDDKKLEEVINKIQEIDDVQTAAIV